jgi:hypothetical protein
LAQPGAQSNHHFLAQWNASALAAFAGAAQAGAACDRGGLTKSAGLGPRAALRLRLWSESPPAFSRNACS